MTDYTKLATEALERAEKATPGPWDTELGSFHYVIAGGEIVATTDEATSDAAFIAAARTDVPTLAHAVLELVEALEPEATKRRRCCEQGHDCIHERARQALKGDQ
jgi:hypothetical protein